MDIKDYILIGGGLLIAAVVAHGFWIAWRSRQEPLRIDIRPDTNRDRGGDIDDIERLRGELPNGGARVISSELAVDPEQAHLELDTPALLDEPSASPSASPPRTEPVVEAPVRARVADVSLPETSEPAAEPPAEGSQSKPIDPSAYPTPGPDPLELPQGRQVAASATAATSASAPEPAKTRGAPPVVSEPQPQRGSSTRGAEGRHAAEPPQENRSRPTTHKHSEPAPDKAPPAAAPAPVPVEELVVLNVLADAGHSYTGDALFAVLRGKGLRFGDMNIFHRTEPRTRVVHYSVANVVEPGTFDMADMEAFRAPGLCFFMQLPGPENPVQAFDDMLEAAQEVVTLLGGELKDEHRNRMTAQTVEHCRQRIVDFSRRRMSRRA